MSLDSLVAGLKAHDVREVRVDLSAWLGEGEDSTFVFREPSIKQVFYAKADAEKLLKRNSDWTRELAMNVALLATCHISPTSDAPAGVLYSELANKRGDIMLHVMGEVNSAFPSLENLGAEAEDRKNA